ncbi:MAG TPA: hypothetical protein VFZ69_10795 [Longimicrobiales bacterium]
MTAMQRLFRRATATGALLLPGSGCTDAVPEWCVAPDQADVRLADEPTAWAAPPRLELAWRLDGSVPGHELLAPVSAAIDGATGRIALVDFRLREVIVIRPDGELHGRWGRAGAGPGELTAPFAAAWRPDGGLIVYDPARSKLVVFDSAGTTLDDVPVDAAFTAALGGGARWLHLDGSGLLLAQPAPPFRGDAATRLHVVVRGGIAGQPVDTIAQREVPVVIVPGASPITAPGWSVPLAAIDGDSILAVADSGPEYLVHVHRGGAPSHTICRMVDPLPLEDGESEPHESDIPDEITAAIARAEPPATPARIGRLVIDAEHRLWIQRNRPRALAALDGFIGRPGARFDVYDPDGAWLGEVHMPPNVRFLGATRDLIIGLESDAFDVLSVIALRPDW